MVVVVDINEKVRSKNKDFKSTPEIESKMLSLEDYITIAKRTISKFSSSSVAKEMLQSDDAISFVAEHLMAGSVRWNPEKGRTMRSYLNQCAIWSIKRWLLYRKNSNKYKEVSLDKEINDDGGTLHEIVPDNYQYDSLDNVEEILKNKCLNDSQRQCLRMKFVEGMTYRAIGEQLGKSGQRIEQIVNTALSKLRENYEFQQL